MLVLAGECFFSFSEVGQCDFCLPVCVATVCGTTQ